MPLLLGDSKDQEEPGELQFTSVDEGETSSELEEMNGDEDTALVDPVGNRRLAEFVSSCGQTGGGARPKLGAKALPSTVCASHFP